MDDGYRRLIFPGYTYSIAKFIFNVSNQSCKVGGQVIIFKWAHTCALELDKLCS